MSAPWTKKKRERIAFWVGQGIAITVTILSIWFAANLGYAQAVRYSRFESIRKTRNILRSVDHELANNERALARALADWDTDEFRHVHVVTRAFDFAKASDEYFMLNPEAAKAVQAVYDEQLTHAISGIRQYKLAPVARTYAYTLTDRMGLIARARPLVEREIDELEKRMREFGLPEESVPKSFPPEVAVAPTPDETEAAATPSTPGWKARPETPYTGKVAEIHRGHTTIPALPRGPNLLTVRLRQGFDDNKVVKVWLVLAKSSPILGRNLRIGGDDAELKRLLSLDPGPGGVTLEVPLPEGATELEILDPNRPAAWHYAWAIAENDKGDRYPLRRLEPWKAGKDMMARLTRKPSPKALILPRGYVPG